MKTAHLYKYHAHLTKYKIFLAILHCLNYYTQPLLFLYYFLFLTQIFFHEIIADTISKSDWIYRQIHLPH